MTGGELSAVDLRVIEELVEREIRMLPKGGAAFDYSRYKSLSRTLDMVREAIRWPS